MKKKFLIALMLITLTIVIFGAVSASAATTVNVSTVAELQSAHPYSNNMDTTWVYTHPTPVDGLKITFSRDTHTFPFQDYIYIYDGNDEQIGRAYDGSDLKGESVTVIGNVVKIRLVTDFSETAYGFSVTNIEPLYKSGSCGNSQTWALDEEGILSISGSGDMVEWSYDTRDSIPWYAFKSIIKGVKIADGVTSISNYAFVDCENLINIDIPNSVTSIGNSAFEHCSNLMNIDIPDSVTNIGTSAFYACKSLKNITFPNSITTIKSTTFAHCNGIESIIIPSNVTTIELDTFFECGNLKSVILSDGVVYIGRYAFGYCSKLETVTIPNTITDIDERAFYECNSLNTINYNGSYDDWDAIIIGGGNDALTDASLNYFLYVNLFSENNNVKTYVCAVNSIFDFTVVPEKKGHTTKIYADETLTNEFDITTPISENKDLYFAYKINQYSHKFLDEDGRILKEETVDYNTVILPPENPSKERTQKYTYTFSGWDGYTSGLTQEDREMFFTAKYKETVNQYTYKFLDEDGSVLKEETVDYGTIITPPTNPIKTEYYLFDYWQGYTEGITLTDDIIFTAVYKYNDYSIITEGLSDVITVTYNDNFSINPQAKDGYTFVGYFTEKDGKGTQITNEKGESLFVYNVAGDLKVYPYFYSSYMNKVELQCVETAMPGDVITQKAIFATDKNAMYLVATVKFPKHLSFKSIKGVDFKEATKDSEKVVGDYKYADITCVFDYEGNFAGINTNYIPFEIEFDVATNATLGNREISIENVMLIGDDSYDITDIKNHTITILPKLAESIEITGSAEIDKATQFTAVVSPDYTTDKSVVWSVDDETVATITQDGTVTPVKNGTVVITATAKDGSEVFATKSVNVITYAKINSLDFGSSVVLTEFNPDVRKYTVYVKENATSISLTPTFSGGGVLRPNGSGVWVSGRPKDFDLNDTATTITLNRENVTDMTNSVYTIEVIKFEGTKTKVSEDKKSFTIKPINIENGKTVILALYDGEQFVEMQSAVYTGEAVPFTTTKTYTKAKVMVWDDFDTLMPLCVHENID